MSIQDEYETIVSRKDGDVTFCDVWRLYDQNRLLAVTANWKSACNSRIANRGHTTIWRHHLVWSAPYSRRNGHSPRNSFKNRSQCRYIWRQRVYRLKKYEAVVLLYFTITMPFAINMRFGYIGNHIFYEKSKILILKILAVCTSC